VGASELLQTAYDLRGVSYRTGGDSPKGFDCSGFIQYVFSRHHFLLPRTVLEQYAMGAPIRREDVREGDLIFFTTLTPGPSHVGLASSAEQFIHAPSDGGAVRVERLDAPYWRDRIVGIKRVF
jgi:cell wall-associated NlpC family hydrolase